MYSGSHKDGVGQNPVFSSVSSLNEYLIYPRSAIEGFVWEAIFHYVKGIELSDSLSSGRTKLLFDAVAADGRGWSLKTILKNNITPGTSFEFVIQRADIFTKSHQLGFPEGLTQNSLPGDLGTAIIRHWNQKFQNDCRKQNVRDPRLAILLKNKTRQNLSYLELAYITQ
jgi:hypothetical protein